MDFETDCRSCGEAVKVTVPGRGANKRRVLCRRGHSALEDAAGATGCKCTG